MTAQNPSTLAEFYDYAFDRYEACNVSFGQGTNDCDEDIAFLLLRTLGLPFGEPLDWTKPLEPGQREKLLLNIRRRTEEKIPTSYLVREAWLAGERFYCDERTLIPRSFFGELLSNRLSPWVRDPDGVTRVLDLCTGSGCLAILAAKAFPNATVLAGDISADALEVAKTNIALHGVQTRVRPVLSDLFTAMPGEVFDIILSNPPYVTADAMRRLPEEFTKEPALGLEAGEDGMDIVRRIFARCKEHLAPGGLLIVEVGDGREAMEKIWPSTPFMWLSTQAEEDMVFLLAKEDIP